MSQIIRITSEALQATVRRLLPSQQGFGEDLQASNVIMPVIDLTPTAEGSQLPVDLARSISLGTETFDVNNVTGNVIANSPGFYRLYASVSISSGSGAVNGSFRLRNGATEKVMWRGVAAANDFYQANVEFFTFLDTGDELTVESSATRVRCVGAVFQVADRYGNIQNPQGFTFE